MEEKTIFRAHDESEWKLPESLDEEPLKKSEKDIDVVFDDIKSVLESLDTTTFDLADEVEPAETEEVSSVETEEIKPAPENKPEKHNKVKKEKTKKGLFSNFSGFGKVIFILGILLIIGSLGVIVYTQFGILYQIVKDKVVSSKLLKF